MMSAIESIYKLYREDCNGHVTTDTRSIVPGALFICLRGVHYDGNRFAQEALDKKAAWVIIDNPDYYINKHTILVEDSLTSLQELARYHRKQLNIPILGITGTNGKTTTKELTTAVLQSRYQVLSTTGNLNNHIGVPLTLLRIHPHHEIAIVEMGANHPGEIEILCRIADPTLGIITNVGKGHLEGFGTIEQVFQTKTALYRHLQENGGTAFVLEENKSLANYLSDLQVETIYYSGEQNHAACSGEALPGGHTLQFTLHLASDKREIQTHLFGHFNLYNTLAAACVGQYMSVPADQIKEALESYTPSNNRSQIQETRDNTLVLDLYNANPSSMKTAIHDFLTSSPETLKACILGDMLEVGEHASTEHLAIIQQVSGADKLFACFIGNQFKQHESAFPTFHFFNNSQEALLYLQNTAPKGYHILLKGSRAIKLETLLGVL